MIWSISKIPVLCEFLWGLARWAARIPFFSSYFYDMVASFGCSFGHVCGANCLDRARILLERLGWSATSEQLVELIEEGVRDQMTLAAFIERIAEGEVAGREEKRVRSWLRLSRISPLAASWKTLISCSIAVSGSILELEYRTTLRF